MKKGISLLLVLVLLLSLAGCASDAPGGKRCPGAGSDNGNTCKRRAC